MSRARLRLAQAAILLSTFVVGYPLWRWVGHRKMNSYPWFMLALSPGLIAGIIVTQIGQSAARRRPPG